MATVSNRQQFQGVFSNVITYQGTLDVASVGTGAEVASDITVTGAALGDFVLVSLGVDVADLVVTAAVTASNTVTVSVVNVTGGTVDLASTTVRIAVLQPNANAFFA